MSRSNCFLLSAFFGLSFVLTAGAQAAELDVATLSQDVVLLMRLSTLELSSRQLDALLAIYSQAPNAPDAAIRKSRKLPVAELAPQDLQLLTSIRARLISGGVVDPHELAVALGTLGQKRAYQFWPTVRNDTQLARLSAVLSADQLARLVQPVRVLAKRRKGTAPPVEPILAQLSKLRDADDEHWTAGVDRIAAGIAVQTGSADSDAYKLTYQDLQDFFARVRKMNDKQFIEGRAELIENLRALVPADYNPALEVTITEKQKRNLLSSVLLAPRTPDLLQEMKQARQGNN